MAWIESHQGIDRHPKTAKLSKLMGWDVDISIAKLHRLWWWCLEYAPDGCVSRHSADMYAEAVGLSADIGEKFISALYDAEYLDRTASKHLVIHDWLEYAGRYLRDTKFKRHPEKYKEIQALYSTVVSRQSADKRPTVSRKSAVPYQPNLTNQPESKTTPPAAPATSESEKPVEKKAGKKHDDYVFEGIPDWVGQHEWNQYVEMRKRIRAPLTDWGKHLTVLELEKLRSQGDDPNVVLNKAIEKSWRGVFKLNGGSHGTHSGGNQGSGQPKAEPGKYAELRPGEKVCTSDEL